ncbi:hypothetical protein [Streptomyces sp. KL116D]|uniref:hypothetical protein n=1 Tax=Streptomyces sp. KL116D TaxID=3045152 RepID=UPI00355678F7
MSVHDAATSSVSPDSAAARSLVPGRLADPRRDLGRLRTVLESPLTTVQPALIDRTRLKDAAKGK